jgi:hypothetical protein
MYPRNTYRIRLSSIFIRQLRVWGKREGAAGAALRAMMKVVHRFGGREILKAGVDIVFFLGCKTNKQNIVYWSL